MQEYTIKSFSKKIGKSEEYIRQACRGYVDSNGKKAKLPDGYEAKKIGSSWIIQKKAQETFLNMPFPVKGLPLDNFNYKKLDLIVLNTENHKTIYLLNYFDFYGPRKKEPGVYYDITSDYLLYLVYKKLYIKITSSKNNFANAVKLTQDLFLENLDWLANCFFEAGKPFYFNRQLHDKLSKQCLYCGRLLDYQSDDQYVFCNMGHVKDFYSRKNSILKSLLGLPLQSRFDVDYIFQNKNSNTVYSEIKSYDDQLIAVAELISNKILKKRKLGNIKIEIIRQSSVYSIFNEAIKDLEIKKELEMINLKDKYDQEKQIKDIVDTAILSKIRLIQRNAITQSPIYYQLILNYLNTEKLV